MNLDRAATVFAVLWCVGFGPACLGAYSRWPVVKWVGIGLMVPFSAYVVVMAVLSAIAFVRAVRRVEM